MNLEALEQQVRHPYVLVVFPDNENLDGLLKAVAETGKVPLICHSFEEAQVVMKHEHLQVIICEDRLPDGALKDILKLAKHRKRPIPVIVSSRTCEWEGFLRALRQGAFDYLALPPRLEEVHRVLELASAESRRATGGGAESAESQQFHASEFVLGLGESKFEYTAFADSQTWGTLGSRAPNHVLLR
jgi:DNA-binding NtrC family response regulator